MRIAKALGLGVLFAGLTLTVPLVAQRPHAGERYHGARGGARVRVERGPRFRAYERYDLYRRPVVVARYRPVRPVIVVRPFRVPAGAAWGWWAHHGFLRATVWLGADGAYYDRDDGDAGLRPVTVYARDGNYYLPSAVPDRDLDGE